MVDYPCWLLDSQPPWFNPITDGDFPDNLERFNSMTRFAWTQVPDWFFDVVAWLDEYLVIDNDYSFIEPPP